jgi:hypothetical protein
MSAARSGQMHGLRNVVAVAAVAMLGLASCTSDDTTGSGGSTTTASGGSGGTSQGGAGGGGFGGAGGAAGSGGMPEQADYYVAPDGNDQAPGDIDHPFATLNQVWTVVEAGNLVYMRGGTYEFDTQQSLFDKSGTSGNLIRVWAYPGETPILSRHPSAPALQGVRFGGEYVHFKGLDLSGFEQPEGETAVYSGMWVEDASHNVFELLNVHHNGAGLNVTGVSDDNLFLNCDFHHNQDPYSTTPYGNADGLGFTCPTVGHTNTVRGCRFWWNTDDGLDSYGTDSAVVVESSWAFWNGYLPGTFDEAATGDGNGFKLGLTTVDFGSTMLHSIRTSVAFRNKARGFDQNGAQCGTELYNNTAYDNGALGFAFATTPSTSTARNNASYDNGWAADFTVGSTVDHDTFLFDGGDDPTYTLDSADFQSLDSTGIDGPRQPDGSLPALPFLRLSPDSDLIDSGVEISGMGFNGAAPDLGAFESGN